MKSGVFAAKGGHCGARKGLQTGTGECRPGTWRCAGVAYGFKPDESGLPAHTLTTQRRAANTLNRLNPSPDRRRAAGLKKRNMAGRCGGGRVHQRRLRGRRGGKRCGGAVQCVAQRQLVEQQAIHRRVVGQQQIEQALCVGGVAGFAGVRGGDGCARPCCGW